MKNVTSRMLSIIALVALAAVAACGGTGPKYTAPDDPVMSLLRAPRHQGTVVASSLPTNVVR